MGNHSVENKTPFYVLAGGTACLVLSLILPIFYLEYTIFGIVETETIGIFETLSSFGMLLYFIAIGLAGYSTKKANDQESAFIYTIVAFLLSGLILLVFNSVKNDVTSIDTPLAGFTISEGPGYYTTMIGMLVVPIGGFMSRGLNDQMQYDQRSHIQKPQYIGQSNIRSQPSPQPQGYNISQQPQNDETISTNATINNYCGKCGSRVSGKFCTECGNLVN